MPTKIRNPRDIFETTDITTTNPILRLVITRFTYQTAGALPVVPLVRSLQGQKPSAEELRETDERL